ncbi:MAG: 16S rRNA (cytosine(1402)-N(4))-methyltransferase RsmH [Actinomycetota bacterium]|nr:16S rRNA (cytosine(1402)-N(4))-methyltransferase RsmH [Actinomycetota bacterium]
MANEHIPVLLKESLFYLDPKPGNRIIDATLGRAGHALAIIEKILPDGKLLGIDKDNSSLMRARAILEDYKDDVHLVKGDFKDIGRLAPKAGFDEVDGILMDLGLSSPQLDEAERGFSYRFDAPIDMRMDKDQGLSAFEVINEYSKEDLAKVIKEYGEERWASRIADFIVRARERSPIRSTFELVEIIKAAIPASARRRGGHPAKQTFQAIRIEVNRELESLAVALKGAVKSLARGGRLVVISYHSLEDRMVKEFFNELSLGCDCPKSLPACVCNKRPVLKILTKKLIVAGEEEILKNPRSKSAKLRAAEKIS